MRESNNDWLRAWSIWFLTIIGIFAAILLGVSYVFWYWLRTRADQLIENEVEKRIDGFKDAVNQVEYLTDELEKLQKQHAVFMIETFLRFSVDRSYNREKLLTLPDQTLIDVFCDENNILSVKHIAAAILVDRENDQFVSTCLQLIL